MFVMQPTRHRSGARAEALADSIAGQWCHGGRNEPGQVCKQPNGDSSKHDRTTIMPHVREGPATPYTEAAATPQTPGLF
jgi:hypothetical protein